ncbi:tetratricopeptide repeat protein [Flavobacterium sp. 3HN19-14]|uniref:tetratricopeptide repeat protein n=1 Tax=Flavobacterium sp. 3HN19-14 TaxID=3448133 RepID=UPI003EE3F5BA
MKMKHIAFAAAMLISVASFAQKDEMKTLKKIYDKDEPTAKDVTEYKDAVAKAEPLIASSTESDKVYFKYFKANIPFLEMTVALAKPENQQNPAAALSYFTPKVINELAVATDELVEFEKKSGKVVYTKEIQEDYPSFKPMLLNYAMSLGNDQAKRYKDAALVLYSMYLLDKKDGENLYYAASYAVNGEDYDTALSYYDELKKINYSGEGTAYYAVNVANGVEEFFNNKADRDRFVKLGSHKSPRDEKIPSRRGEIYKNIALILVQKGKNAEAKAAIKEARTNNPQDTSLMITEANLYLQEKDLTTYKSLINEILAQNPNNAELVFNLGVLAYQNKEMAEAEKYYLKAIELDPNYGNAYLNLAILKLDPEEGLINQMNALGTSAAENKKYEVLKTQRLNVFKSAIPYLEKAVELNADNFEAASTLLNVYKALEMTDKAKPLKEKVDALKAKQGK